MFAQLYIYDPATAHKAQCCQNSGLNPLTLQALHDVLWESHPYAAVYCYAHKLFSKSNSTDLTIQLHCIGDKRCYNLPIANEVAVIIPENEDADATGPHNIILHRLTESDTLQTLRDGHPAYSCLHYVLLFPTGQHRWHWELRLCDPPSNTVSNLNDSSVEDHNDNNQGSEDSQESNEDDDKAGHSLTQTRFYADRLHPRRNEFSTILHAGKLLQQYMVNAWASSNQTWLNWFQMNQSTIHASLYSGLQDATARADANIDLNSIAGAQYYCHLILEAHNTCMEFFKTQ